MRSTKSLQFNFVEQPPRRRICTSWIVPVLLLWMLPAGLGLMLAGRVSAQVFTTLYSFTGGTDGGNPSAGLILSGNTLYGSSTGNYWDGIGPVLFGLVFSLNIDGTGFTNHAVGGPFSSFQDEVGIGLSDLILSGDTLYGVCVNWVQPPVGNIPVSAVSSVFAVNTDGMGVTNLCGTGASGLGVPLFDRYPAAGTIPGLILSGNTLYGTAYWGATDGNGTVFAVNTNGTGFTNLYSFSAPDTNGFNSDGGGPSAGLVLSGNTLYGTAVIGGSSGNGTVFAVNTDGTGFTTLHTFTGTSTNFSGLYTNSDGANPLAGLILSGNMLYGTAEWGGSSGNGTVFALNTDGTGFTNLYTFMGTSTNFSGFGTNSGGANPVAGLILSGNTLYGTARWGGSSGNGTVFAVNTDGTGFTTLHTFTGPPPGPNSDGANPVGGLILSGNTLYGTAPNGGTNGYGYGTVFSIFIQPQLTMIPSGPYVILTWPTNYSGFTLQSTTNLGSAAVWTTNSPTPVVIGGQNMVINTTSSDKQKFFRLSQ